jgi:hypothetical protein
MKRTSRLGLGTMIFSLTILFCAFLSVEGYVPMFFVIIVILMSTLGLVLLVLDD